jgi:hypothetical protein
MKEIKLTQGKVAIVDDEDFEELNKVKWYAYKGGRTFYAVRSPIRGKPVIRMHRVLLPEARFVDHIDHDGLNNTRANLRAATSAQNSANSRKPQKPGHSKFKGVTKHPHGKWQAQIKADGKYRYLGLFDTEEAAAKAYDDAAHRLFGEFACANDRP